jgi:hypothetical protein
MIERYGWLIPELNHLMACSLLQLCANGRWQQEPAQEAKLFNVLGGFMLKRIFVLMVGILFISTIPAGAMMGGSGAGVPMMGTHRTMNGSGSNMMGAHGTMHGSGSNTMGTVGNHSMIQGGGMGPNNRMQKK